MILARAAAIVASTAGYQHIGIDSRTAAGALCVLSALCPLFTICLRLNVLEQLWQIDVE